MGCNNGDINSSRSRREDSKDSEKKPIFFYALILISVNILMLYLFRDGPSTPSFEIDDVGVSFLESRNSKSNHIRGDFSLFFIVKNNNFKKKEDGGIMLFSLMEMSLKYKRFGSLDELLASADSLNAFVIDAKQRQVEIVMHNVTVDSISGDLKGGNGNHVLQFGLQSQGHYVRAYKDYFDSCGIQLDCENIRLTFLTLHDLTYGIGINLPLRCKCKTHCRSKNY